MSWKDEPSSMAYLMNQELAKGIIIHLWGMGDIVSQKILSGYLPVFRRLLNSKRNPLGFLLSMKAGSDNYRGSAVFGLIH